jgi:hypothetical protein
MKKAGRIIAVALFAMLSTSVARAQTLTAAERDRALQYLETTKKILLDSTSGLSEAQWNFKPTPFRWSAAQVMEHIAASEDTLRGILQQQVLKAPAAPGRDLKADDEKVLAMVPDRSFKVEAPQMLRPTNRFNSPAEALKHFVESRGKTVELLKTTPDLREHATDSAVFKKMDGYQFILLIAAHTERHTKQLNELKTDPKYPSR